MELEIEFEVKSKLGKLISTKGKQKLVMQTLVDPGIIKRSSKDRDVYLYYHKLDGKFLCAVTKHENGTGFLITAYLTDKIKEGDIIWTK